MRAGYGTPENQTHLPSIMMITGVPRCEGQLHWAGVSGLLQRPPMAYNLHGDVFPGRHIAALKPPGSADCSLHRRFERLMTCIWNA